MDAEVLRGVRACRGPAPRSRQRPGDRASWWALSASRIGFVPAHPVGRAFGGGAGFRGPERRTGGAAGSPWSRCFCRCPAGASFAWSWMAPWTARISDSRARFFPTISDRNGGGLAAHQRSVRKSKKAIPGWPEDRGAGSKPPRDGEVREGRCRLSRWRSRVRRSGGWNTKWGIPRKLRRCRSEPLCCRMP